MNKDLKKGSGVKSEISPADGKPMLPAVFQKELNKLSVLNADYKEQLDKVVDEITKVFGKSPYEVDCDSFIDAYCQGSGHITVQELNFEMLMRCP